MHLLLTEPGLRGRCARGCEFVEHDGERRGMRASTDGRRAYRVRKLPQLEASRSGSLSPGCEPAFAKDERGAVGFQGKLLAGDLRGWLHP